MNPDRIVASGWYAANIGPPFVAIEDAIGERQLARLRAGRGLLIYLAARAGAGAALLRRERGALTALGLAAVFGGTRIVVLELIPDRPARPGWRRTLKRAWFRAVERPIVRRGMRAGQTLSAVERTTLAALYGIPPERLVHVPWALTRTATVEIASASERTGVVSSGRAACDWETLFAAAGPDWQLTVVCGERERARVEALDATAGTRARILSEITRDEHDELMRRAAVYVMPLTEDRLSSGQVRLQTATELGAPVVVSRISTLGEYVIEDQTALQVSVGEASELRTAVDSLLADPARRDRLASVALERARARTYPDYFRAVREMVETALGIG